ncbi:amino acid permease [Metallibacterium scheffleri]|uniref:Amino acid permease n=1 Tax=Metallibacterium scheffleri TaxID=993689 RepID=A0A4S3KE70_9GAMM|nr:amino acid permease [Metallibacterium scheffleri]THD06548.1 amino acid permease [Metallibacterium scheffleri]
MNSFRVKPLDDIIATAEKHSLTRQLGAFQLTMLGIGAIIGTGIFVLTAEAAQKAGPGMMISFIIAGSVCALAALAYAELAAMVPVSGSAYTYTYAVMGEALAWMVGWALILEYAVSASAVAVGWSGYFNGLLQSMGLRLPEYLRVGFFSSGAFNLVAFAVSLLITALLVLGTTESARVNAFLVLLKVAALTVFVVVAVPAAKTANFTPFLPTGWGSPLSGSGLGVLGAAASIFFAYVGFDAVSTAAEETKNPNRNIPIGLIGSLIVCTVYYLLVGYGAIGADGAQPMMVNGHALQPGSPQMAAACQGVHNLVCSKEALSFVLRDLGFPSLGYMVALAASIALPSVILMMIYGQTRIFFTMSRDGLLPKRLSKVHPRFRTPHVITMITGAFVALFASQLSVGALADISNAGTLFAFAMVSLGVLILRYTQPDRHRPFRIPNALVWPICVGAVVGCVVLFMSLDIRTKLIFFAWAAVGLVIYALYGMRHSDMARKPR